jgi:hypothetical protein
MHPPGSAFQIHLRAPEPMRTYAHPRMACRDHVHDGGQRVVQRHLDPYSDADARPGDAIGVGGVWPQPCSPEQAAPFRNPPLRLSPRPVLRGCPPLKLRHLSVRGQQQRRPRVRARLPLDLHPSVARRPQHLSAVHAHAGEKGGRCDGEVGGRIA